MGRPPLRTAGFPTGKNQNWARADKNVGVANPDAIPVALCAFRAKVTEDLPGRRSRVGGMQPLSFEGGCSFFAAAMGPRLTPGAHLMGVRATARCSPPLVSLHAGGEG